MLEHGFVCVGTSEPSSSAQPVMTASADGSASLQVLPPGWNSFEDSYAFFYMHPFRQNEDSFTVKAVGIGSSLAVHAASSAPNADLLETKLSVSQDAVDNDPVSVAARAKAWQEKVAVGVAQRLLSRHNSTARLGTALEAAPSEKAGTKRPAPEEPRREPPRHDWHLQGLSLGTPRMGTGIHSQFWPEIAPLRALPMRPRETGNAWTAEPVSSGPWAPEGSLRRVASRMPPAQSPQLMQLLLLLVLAGLSGAQDIQMCENIRDDLGAASCAQVLEANAKGFRLTGTMSDPLRFAGLGFDDNIAGGETPGALNVCMLAAFGDGGVIPAACVPTVGTTADQWDGVPEMHYFGMMGFDCSFNHAAYAVGETIDWNYPTGNTCVGDGDLDVGLTSIKCMFESAHSIYNLDNHAVYSFNKHDKFECNEHSDNDCGDDHSKFHHHSDLHCIHPHCYNYRYRHLYNCNHHIHNCNSYQKHQVHHFHIVTCFDEQDYDECNGFSHSDSDNRINHSYQRYNVLDAHLCHDFRQHHYAYGFHHIYGYKCNRTATTETLTATAVTSASTTAVTSTGTGTSTVTSTGSPDINITGRFCPESPMIANSASLANCAGTPHDSVCDVECSDGFTRPGLADPWLQEVAKDVVLALCHEGQWRIRGECLPEGTNVTQSGAAQVLLDVSVDLPELSNFSDGYYWARAHETALYWAFAKTLGVHPAELRIELLQARGSVRRLLLSLSHVAFTVRLTMLLQVNVSRAAMEQAAQELAGLSSVPKMAVFEAALLEELDISNQTDGNISAASSVADLMMIDDYTLAQPSWYVSNWDMSGCDDYCASGSDGGGQQVGEVLCSRGLRLACEGPMQSMAGPQPSATRSCPPCPPQVPEAFGMPMWALGSAGVVGCCCCTLCGIFLAYRCLRALARAMPPEPFSGTKHLKDMKDIEASYTVQPAVRPIKSRKRTVNFNDAEPGFMRRLSTFRTKSMATHAQSEEMNVEETKTHVVWTLTSRNVDMSQLTTMFPQTTSKSDRQEQDEPARSSLRDASSPKRSNSRASFAPGLGSDEPSAESPSHRQTSPSAAISRQRSGTLLDRVDLVGPTETDITLEWSKL
eukprot:s1614_g16.t1